MSRPQNLVTDLWVVLFDYLLNGGLGFVCGLLVYFVADNTSKLRPQEETPRHKRPTSSQRQQTLTLSG